MCFDVSIPIRLICSTDGPLCLRSATTSFWHARCRRGPSTPTDSRFVGCDLPSHRGQWQRDSIATIRLHRTISSPAGLRPLRCPAPAPWRDAVPIGRWSWCHIGCRSCHSSRRSCCRRYSRSFLVVLDGVPVVRLILDLTGRNVADQLRELQRVARAFETLSHHCDPAAFGIGLRAVSAGFPPGRLESASSRQQRPSSPAALARRPTALAWDFSGALWPYPNMAWRPANCIGPRLGPAANRVPRGTV